MNSSTRLPLPLPNHRIRPRIVYIHDFPTLAPTAPAWYPHLLSAVCARRTGPQSSKRMRKSLDRLLTPNTSLASTHLRRLAYNTPRDTRCGKTGVYSSSPGLQYARLPIGRLGSSIILPAVSSTTSKSLGATLEPLPCLGPRYTMPGQHNTLRTNSVGSGRKALVSIFPVRASLTMPTRKN
ncbi:hypothetical protein JVT61DRAFT_11848 [Boletus reticuloceps]|uniref:Uncharacterized protein n=1 Tax=Boletus reticuloceps TaxID=495285 RepID=A0A8I3ADF3_9AGAM|nr:hypothetical protein JVT61DRAFT_11848 [Boletus reticuloceps]